MPYTPHEEQPTLFADIERLGCSRKTIARLCDHQENVLTRALAGTRDIPWPEFRVIRAVVDDLVQIKQRFPYVPIDWSDVASLRKLIADLHEEQAMPPEPLTAAESERLAKFSAGVDVGDLAINAGMSKSEFLEHVESLLARSARIAAVSKRQVVAAA